ncbi:glucosamine-6-phosphate deaminase [Luteolibacter yonseiensis]|uniref:Glucosamine-6-phosphate deaminase n=1 Tax=Luteolibacter yonseiensis TaxID=1144680 RepID=A0A934R798_9BACT|nr:glucosamine-6-phosphate deaminase [Luteolibacter yonseiensis]MBK1817258.1 glucosamine-6-phosphate deaminase [Luteolibacter yonseiensis]
MEIIIQPTRETATEIAARIIARLLSEKPDAVLGLATGSTPLLLYQKLVGMRLDWSRVRTFNLDEYIGLPKEHSQSYHSFMWENLFKHINISPDNVHIPDGNAEDIPGSCKAYEKRILEEGGIDLQVLGIGSDGHIGFNEPTSSLASRTRIKTLTRQTCKDNARFFGSEAEVPKHVITMGIGTIMEARHNLLLAFGEQKAGAVAGAVEGPVASVNPASVLQMHPTVTVCLDEGAASGLQRAEYYRWVYENKPAWQIF